jgi:hypothetical protein
VSWIRFRIRHSQIMAQRRQLTGVASRWPRSHSWFRIYRKKTEWKMHKRAYLRDAKASGALLYWRLKYGREDRERASRIAWARRK